MVASTVPGSVTGEAQELAKAVTELLGAFNVAPYVVRGWDLQGLRHKEEAREARRLDEGHGSKNDRKATHRNDLLDILMYQADRRTRRWR
jgi:hypothetical protein